MKFVMSSTLYSYEDLIEAYFRSIKRSFSRFTTDGCRSYVRKFRHRFDDEQFLRAVAKFLVAIDDELSDYSLNSDG
jgi:hypothetical protein